MFRSSNHKESLQKKYNQLMEESYKLSQTNRRKSDMKRAEAEEIGKLLDAAEKNSSTATDTTKDAMSTQEGI